LAEPEFRMFSTWHPYKERYAQFLEALQLLTEAWTKKSVSFSGKFYNVQDCIVEPKPVQKPYPPLLFGGWSNNRILRQAGKMGDGWTPTGPRSGEAVKSPADYSRFVLEIEKGRNEANGLRKNSPLVAGLVPWTTPEDMSKRLRATEPLV
jgi:alkanesulfonate monooxygenase SsuD/methylene tetrahydromethanopterin reductase-like flavin-dependent oxidoreductase (luciferase family)